jgi:hypothetical protein
MAMVMRLTSGTTAKKAHNHCRQQCSAFQLYVTTITHTKLQNPRHGSICVVYLLHKSTNRLVGSMIYLKRQGQCIGGIS